MAHRRGSREQATAEEEDLDIFDDEYEVDDLDGAVADGFRPGGHEHNENEQNHHTPWHTPPSPIPTVRTRTNPPTQTSSQRNSLRKDVRFSVEDPFASAEDHHSLTFEPDAEHDIRRSTSSASSQRFVNSGSSRFGTGPSHPYAMYPQGTTGRTASVASASTTQPSHGQSISSRGGPQHPYAMYPQGVEEDLDEHDDVDLIATNPVPMGFLAAGQPYQRRVGPDGEEQDLIGELGHTEQLPPYSRYPEDGPEKVPLLAPETPSPLHSRAPVAGTDPTMPLMHTVIAPQPPSRMHSMTDPSALPRSSLSTLHSSRFSRDYMYDEKSSWKQKSWKQRWKTRYFKVPIWLCAVLTILIITIAAVLGGVIGGFVANVKKHHQAMMGPSTSLLDASTIPTPTDMAPPTGTFKLVLSTPTAVQNGCLVNSAQSMAWSCQLAGQPATAMVVGTPAGLNDSGAFIYYASDSSQVYYGAQVASLQSTFAPFLAVIDNEMPGSGPAYYFQQFFDKQVVLPENALVVSPAGTGKIKRGITFTDQWSPQQQPVQAGDKPWLCVWNQTFLEGFIYVEQAIASSYSFSTATTSTSTSSSIATMSTSGSTVAHPTSPPAPPPTGAQPLTTTLALPTTTATYTGPASDYASWSASVASPPPSQKQQQSNYLPHRDTTWSDLEMFPFIVKLEERRLPGNPYQPTCQQYQILDNQIWSAYPDGSPNPIVIYLDEQDPSMSSYQNKDGLATSRRSVREQEEIMDECHCEWFSGQ